MTDYREGDIWAAGLTPSVNYVLLRHQEPPESVLRDWGEEIWRSFSWNSLRWSKRELGRQLRRLWESVERPVREVRWEEEKEERGRDAIRGEKRKKERSREEKRNAFTSTRPRAGRCLSLYSPSLQETLNGSTFLLFSCSSVVYSSFPSFHSLLFSLLFCSLTRPHLLPFERFHGCDSQTPQSRSAKRSVREETQEVRLRSCREKEKQRQTYFLYDIRGGEVSQNLKEIEVVHLRLKEKVVDAHYPLRGWEEE